MIVCVPPVGLCSDMRRLMLATIFLTAFGGVDAFACTFTPFRFASYGQNTWTDMQAASRKPCSVAISTGGRHSFSAIVISTQARNGMARANATSVTYQSRPGYRGTDAFVFTMTGRDASGSGRSSIEVSVTVR